MDVRRLEEITLDEWKSGLKQSSPPSKVPATGFIRFDNARISADGVTPEKRPGLEQFDATYSFSSKRVLGAYGIIENSEVKTLIALPDSLRYKTGGAWSTLFSPTTPTDLPVSICQYKGITFVAGYEQLITVIGGVAGYAGLVAPLSAPTVANQASGSAVSILSVPTASRDRFGELRSVAGATLIAQSFKPTATTSVSSVKLSVKKVGAPTGNIWVEIHSSQSGTSATKNASTGINGQGSDNVDVAGLTTAFADQTFTFSGTKPALTQGTTYYLVVFGSFAVSTTNYAVVGCDFSAPSYTDGSYWSLDGSFVWTADTDVDMVFEVTGTESVNSWQLQIGDNSATDQWSLGDDVLRTMLATKFQIAAGATISAITLVMKRTGTPDGNLWVEIHSSTAGTSTTKNASANIVGQASDNVVASTLNDSGFGYVSFSFTGTKPTLSATTDYYLVVYNSSTIDGSNYPLVAFIAHTGFTVYEITSTPTWGVGDGNYSLCFWLYGMKTSFKIAENALTYNDDVKELRETTSQTLLAQTIQITEAREIYSVKLYLSKVGSPTGNMWAEIHSSQVGTTTASGTSANIVGTPSETLDVATVSAFPTYTEYELHFTGTEPVLAAGVTYYLVIYGSQAVSTTAYIKVGMVKGATPVVGSMWELNASLVWTEKNWREAIFNLYALTGGIPGTRKYVITYYRGGNYPTESNPGPESASLEITAGNIARLTNIPVSTDSRVTARRIYRTEDDAATFFFCYELADNSTTTWDDDLDDTELGTDEVSYLNYQPPKGDCLESWDGKLWVSNGTELIYHSLSDLPESFSPDDYLPLRERESSNVVAIKQYNNDLYVFKKSSVWCVQRSGTSDYITDKLIPDIGLGARASLVEAKGLLIFLSNHGQIEIFADGRVMTPRLSDDVIETLKTINKTFMHRSVAEHYVPRNEYRLAIPTGTNQHPDTVIVFDYSKAAWAIDKHSARYITCLSSMATAENERSLVYGTSTGELLVFDEDAMDDAGTSIGMDIQTGWIGDKNWRNVRRTYLDFALPESKNLTVQVYKNFEADSDYSVTLTGETPAGSETTLRDTIHERLDMNVQGNYVSFRFTESDNTARFKLERISMLVRKRGAKHGIEAP